MGVPKLVSAFQIIKGSTNPCWLKVKLRPLSWELGKFLLQDSSVSTLELSKLYIESLSLPSLVANLKSFQFVAEAGNFIVQEFLQRSKAISFIATNQVCECK